MNAAAIFGLIERGLALLPIIAEAGGDAWDTIERLRALSEAGRDGTVTDQMLTDVETHLDEKFAEFNSPLPEENE